MHRNRSATALVGLLVGAQIAAAGQAAVVDTSAGEVADVATSAATPASQLLELPVEVGSVVAAALGHDVPVGASLAIDPLLLVPTGASGRPPSQLVGARRGHGRSAFALTVRGAERVLADHDGDGVPELSARGVTGGVVLDGATGRSGVRIPEDLFVHAGFERGRPQLLALGGFDVVGDRADCVVEGPAVGIGTCLTSTYTFTSQLVFRDGRTGRERWRADRALTFSSNQLGSFTGARDTQERGIRTAVPLLFGDELRGAVTADLRGSTTIEDDPGGISGRAHGEGTATLQARDTDGDVLAERTLEVGGPSNVAMYDDVTGDRVPEVALLVNAWDDGTFLCLPVVEQGAGAPSGGCLFPYQGAHLDVLVLDGRTLETVQAWSHAEPVGREPFGTWLLPTGDVDTDGRSDAVATWQTFQDRRWSTVDRERRTAMLTTDGRTAGIGSVGVRRGIAAVRRGAGSATVLLTSLSGGVGPDFVEQPGFLPVGPAPVGPGYDVGPERIRVEATTELIDLPSGLTAVVHEHVLERRWVDGADPGDRILLLGIGTEDRDGDALPDHVIGVGHEADGPWQSEVLWTGSTTGVVFGEVVGEGHWRMPRADLDVDGTIDSDLLDYSEFMGPRTTVPTGMYRGTGSQLLWRRPSFQHRVGHTADLDGVPGPEVVVQPYDDDPDTDDRAFCVVHGTTGRAFWCFDGD